MRVLRASDPSTSSRIGSAEHWASAPDGWPAVGSISPAQLAIMGLQGYSFLFAGSNDYYERFGEFDASPTVDQWEALLAARQAKIDRHCNFVSLFVPAKATCMADLYPALLPRAETAAHQGLRQRFADNPRMLFGKRLLELSAPGLRDSMHPWHYADTHWTQRGAAESFSEVLQAFGLPPLQIIRTALTEPDLTIGDLARRWPGRTLLEHTGYRLGLDAPEPTLSFDAASGIPVSALTGWRVVWSNPEACVDASLAIVGNSFCLTGWRNDGMVWWAARTFRTVTMIWSAAMPTDLLESLRPDYVLFQHVERFLGEVPEDRFTVEETDARFSAANTSGNAVDKRVLLG